MCCINVEVCEVFDERRLSITRCGFNEKQSKITYRDNVKDFLLFFCKGGIVHLLLEVMLETSIGVHLRIFNHWNVCFKSNLASIVSI